VVVLDESRSVFINLVTYAQKGNSVSMLNNTRHGISQILRSKGSDLIGLNVEWHVA
jgi:hypothetical protein